MAVRDRPHVVVVGAGFGGLYAVRALKRADVRITVIDRHNYHLFQPLLYQVATAGLSPGDIAHPIRSVLRRQKNARVLLADAVKVDVHARTVLWAAGVTASPLAASLGVPLDRAGRVLVEPDLSVPGHPEVFVIGDLAGFTHQTGAPLPGLAPVAIQQGRQAVSTILRRCRRLSSEPFRYVDRGTLATIGQASAVADFGRVRLSGFFAWLVWIFVHIFFLIGFRNRVAVLLDWAWAYVALQRSARLITGEGGNRGAAYP